MSGAAADLYNRQLQLEISALEEGISYFKRAQRRHLPSERKTGQTFLRDCFDLLATAIRVEQNSTIDSKTRPKLRSHDIQLVSLDAEKLALVTLRTMFNQTVRKKGSPTLARLAREIGSMSYLERTLNVKCGTERNVEKLLRKRNKNRWNATRRSQEYSARANDDWSIQDRDIRLGLELLNLAIKHVLLKKKPVFEVDGERASILRLSEAARDWLKKRDLQYEKWARPFYLPMIIPPRPWTKTASGGYLRITNIELVKKRRSQIQRSRVESVDHERVLNSVNLLQNTPWIINSALYRIITAAHSQNFPLPGTFQAIPLPKRLPDNSAIDQLKRHKAERARIHQHNAVAGANQQLMKLRLQWGRTFLNEKALFFPYQLDSRGRIYPIPQVFHPQADDMGRALLEFRDGKPLSSKGVHWLGIHIANMFGYDKVSFDERLKWLRRHEQDIVDSATDPLNSRRLWLEAERPWLFLAACLEWNNYRRYGEQFCSRIPVVMDGTCNGLQHLSALGRDPVGALATNLVPASEPQDIYQQVATIAERQVRIDREAGIPNAASWPSITRKLVKRATMTTPYGVTLRGIRDQLIREHFAEDFLSETWDSWKRASYLAHVLQSSIATVVVKGIEIMKWLKSIARILAKSDRPLKWTLPTGFVAVHDYRTQRERRIVTAERTLVIYEDESSQKINVRKQLNAIAPNLIHSLDAAHLMLTVLKLADHGLSHFAMVHDSYGVHACDIDLMNRILREEFVATHEKSTLNKLFQEQCEANPDLASRLPAPPSTGDFNINEVLKSDYFFA